MSTVYSIRESSALSYVEGLEYRKELARLLARQMGLSVNIIALLDDAPAVVERLLADIQAQLNDRGLLQDTAEAALQHGTILGIARGEAAAGLADALDDIVSESSARVLTEADTMLLARAGEVNRTIGRMLEEGVSIETILKSVGEGAGREAILGPLVSGAVQTAVGLIAGADMAVAREAVRLDTAASVLTAPDGGEPMLAWETREDKKVCEDLFENSCAPRHGEELPLTEWEAMGQPGAENLICSIYAKGAFSNCRCKLVRPDMVEKLPEPLQTEEAAARGKDRAQSEISREIPSAAKSSAETGGAALTSAKVQPSGAVTQEEASKFQISSRPSPDAGITARRIEPSTLEGGTISREFIDPSRPILQPEGSAQDFIRMGQEALPGFTATLDKAVAEIPGVSYVDNEPAGVARVKKPPTPGSRLESKLRTRGAQQIDDYLGGRLQFNSPESFGQLMDYLQSVYGAPLKIDNFLETGKQVWMFGGPGVGKMMPNGYRAIHITVRLPNGLAAEIQLIPEQIATIKSYWHENVFTKYRDYTPKSPAEWLEAESAIAVQNKSFEEAYAAYLRGEPLPPKPVLSDQEIHALERPWEVTPAEFKAAALHAREGLWRGGYYGPFSQTSAGITPAKIAVKWGDQVFVSQTPISHGELAGLSKVPIDQAIPGVILDDRFIYTSPDAAYAAELRWALKSDVKIPTEVLDFFDLNPSALADLPLDLQSLIKDQFALRMFEQGQPAIRLKSGEVIVGEFSESHWEIAAKHGLSIDDIKDTGFIGPMDETGVPGARARYHPAALEEGNITIHKQLPVDMQPSFYDLGLTRTPEEANALAEKLWPGKEYRQDLLDKATIETRRLTSDQLNEIFKNAAVSDSDKTITIWHVTSDPAKLMEALGNGADLVKAFGRSTGDLGPGLYGSAAPQLWTGRAAGKWTFLEGMTLENRKKLADAIVSSWNFTTKGYLTASEIASGKQLLAAFVESGFSAGIVSLADQPYNVAFWKPSFLEPLGIEPGKPLQVVAITLRGKFIDLSKTDAGLLWNDESDLLRLMGFDGAFVSGGMFATPQLVVWNTDAIVSWKVDPEMTRRILK